MSSLAWQIEAFLRSFPNQIVFAGSHVQPITGTRPLPVPPPISGRPRPVLGRPHAGGSDGSDRQGLLSHASQLLERARLSAEAGDIEEAAQTILQSLDCERRAGGLGPQVLQLIKPR
jgi:hypothetical protein